LVRRDFYCDGLPLHPGKVSSFISSNKISSEVRSPSDIAIFAAGLAPTAVFRRRIFDGFRADKLLLNWHSSGP